MLLRPILALGEAIMLKVRGLSAGYGVFSVVSNVDIEVTEGSITAIVGSNGAGKTTLLKAVAGLLRPNSGSVQLNGEELIGLNTSQIVRKGLTLVPEGRELFPRMSVKENLICGAYARWGKCRIREELDDVYALFPVLERKGHIEARGLSGGEQQMLAFGRALLAQPKCLLLDEPSIGLAPLVEAQLMEGVKKIAERRRVAVLLVEQNAALALEAASFAYVIELGRIVLKGTGKDLLKHPGVQKAYLGG